MFNITWSFRFELAIHYEIHDFRKIYINKENVFRSNNEFDMLWEEKYDCSQDVTALWKKYVVEFTEQLKLDSITYESCNYEYTT